MKKWLWLLPFLLLAACQAQGPPELEQGARVIEEALKPVNLSRSMFAAAFPEGTPSQFVNYYFSDMGVAEWPPSEAWVDDFEREQFEAIRATLWPADVGLVPDQPALDQEKQIVLTADDARGVVIVTAYLDPAAEPVFSREFVLPQVTPAPGIEEIYRANLDEGLSPVRP